nr:FAD-dependent oxidoreductase [Sphingobium estronivorans]
MSGKASWITNNRLKETTAAEFVEKLSQGIQAFCDVDGMGGRSIFPRPYAPFFKDELVRQFDKLSIQDRLDQLTVSQEIKDLTASLMAMGAANTVDQGAFLDWVKWWSLNDYSLQNFGDRQARYKIHEGTGALARAIAADAPVDLKLSTPVDAVEQSEAGAIVRAGGAIYRAKEVICAVPLAVLHSIRFTPALPPAKLEAAKTANVTRGRKVYFNIRERIDNWSGVAPPPYPVTYAFKEDDFLRELLGRCCKTPRMSRQLLRLIAAIGVSAPTLAMIVA